MINERVQDKAGDRKGINQTASNKEARVESRFYSNHNGKVLDGLIRQVSPSYLFTF